MTNRSYAAPGDITDAAADHHERRQRANKAVEAALTAVSLLVSDVEELRASSGSQRFLAAELAEVDLASTARLLNEAERRIEEIDPLEALDDEMGQNALATARLEWRSCAYALGVDVLSISASTLARAS